MKTRVPRKDRRTRGKTRLSAAKLDALIAEALVDAYGDSEQRTAFFTVFHGRRCHPSRLMEFHPEASPVLN